MNASPETVKRTMGQKIHPVPRMGSFPMPAAANPLTRIPTTPGMVNQRSLRMMPSNVAAIREKSRVLWAREAQNTPVVMFPRKMTTEAT